MYISTIIKELALAAGFTFYHGPKDFQNMQDQKVDKPFPILYLTMPIRAKGTKSKQGFSEQIYDLELLFADRSKIEWETDQHIIIIEDMDDKCHKFINQMMMHPEVKEVLAYDTLEVINLFDTNITGVIANISVKPFDRRPNCP